LKYILILPAFLFFALFTAWPLFEVFRLSVYKTNFITSTFIGLDNYIVSFQSEAFIKSITNSLFYAAILVPGQVILGLGMALYIFKMSKKWQDVSRIMFYLPMLSAGIIIAQCWKWIFHINGPINWLIGLCGFKALNWFGQFYTSIPVIAFIVLISSFGGNVIIFLAAIQAINKDYFEAAMIDGAGWRLIKSKIIYPLIAPTIGLIALLSGLNSLMIFETIYALNPQEYTATMAFSVYSQGFMFSKYGMASAQAVILLFVSVVIMLIKKRLERD
jgi:multiple sugar transport system permease protein